MCIHDEEMRSTDQFVGLLGN